MYKGYKQDKIEMRGDRAEMSDFPLYLNTVAGGLDRRDLICPLSSRQVKYLKVSDKNTYISFWSVGIFMHTISLYIF